MRRGATGAFIGGSAVVQGDEVRIFVGFSPRRFEPGLEELSAGLVALSFRFDAGLTPSLDDDQLVLSSQEKLVAFDEALDAPTTLVNVIEELDLITAALGCNGVATYTLDGALIQVTPAVGGAPSAFMDCAVGPNGYLYCTSMDGRLWVFDPFDMSAPLSVFETPGQAAFLEPTGGLEVPGKAGFYLTDFRSGVHRIEVPVPEH